MTVFFLDFDFPINKLRNVNVKVVLYLSSYIYRKIISIISNHYLLLSLLNFSTASTRQPADIKTSPKNLTIKIFGTFKIIFLKPAKIKWVPRGLEGFGGICKSVCTLLSSLAEMLNEKYECFLQKN